MTKNILLIAAATPVLLLIPVIANMDWTAFDYIVAWLLLFVTGCSITLVSYRLKDKKKRIFAILLLLILFLYIWIELAVGIFTTLGN